MRSALKVTCCAIVAAGGVLSAVSLGVLLQQQGLAQSLAPTTHHFYSQSSRLDRDHFSIGSYANFTPQPNQPPRVTKGSGTR